MAISKGRALSATVNSATSIIKSSIDGTATIATLEQAAQQYANADALPSIGNTFGEMALVQSTNRMYVWNGSGWYHIALINANPSFTTSPDSNYTFDGDSPRNNIVITVAATDPESLGVSFSFETGGSMDSMADIIQDSSVFTLVPKGNDSIAAGAVLSGSLTIKATDGVNIVPAVSQFTLTFLSIIPNSSHNTVLLKATGTGNNNTFLDGSTSNHTITVGGTPRQVAYSPFRSGGYSVFFDGSGDYLRDDTIGDTLSNGSNSTNDFTIEMWIYNLTDPTTAIYFVGSNQLANAYNDMIFGSNKVYYGGVQVGVNYGATHGKQYEWQHYVLTHKYGSGNTSVVTLWIDGLRVFRATGVNSGISHANNSFAFGTEADAANFGSLGNYFHGYMYDMKITNTELYTSTDEVIPVPTEPSTPHETLNVFHGFQNGSFDKRFFDTGVIGGGTDFQPFTPLDYNKYSTSSHIGSVYFDGSGDYITASTAETAGTGTFTAECWFYHDGVPASSGCIMCQRDTNPTTGNYAKWIVYVESNGNLAWYNGVSGQRVVESGAGGFRVQSWHHVAITRDSSNVMRMFRDGVLIGSRTAQTQNWNYAPFTVGANGDGSQAFKGWISNVRWTVGEALYTSAFTPSTTPLTVGSNTKLLLNAANAKITDRSQINTVVLGGSTVASSAQQHFGENVIDFEGATGNSTSSYLSLLSSTVMNSTSYNIIDFSTAKAEDFVIECWIYKTSTQQDCWFSHRSSSTVELSILLDSDSGGYSAGDVQIEYDSAKIYFDGGILQNQWQHIAFVRTGTTISWYTDGVLKDSRTEPASLPYMEEDFEIGRFAGSQFYYGGYMHDFRITRGRSLFPYIAKPKILTTTNSNMEKPDGTFPTVSGGLPPKTIFLIGHTNSIVDGSANNTSITTHGNTQMSPNSFAPKGAEAGMTSIHFDGNGDYLSATTASTLGTGDWTVEYWVWHDEFGSNQIHLAFGTYAPAFYYRHSSSTFKFSFYQTGAGLSSNVWTTYAPKPRKWYHLAWVHDDSENKLALYVNGSFWGDTTYTGNTTSTSLRVGDDTSSAWMDGNISNLRIVKEKLYDENFTPRTTAIIA